MGPGGDLESGFMSVREAKARCASLAPCRGFTLQGGIVDESRELHVTLKDKFEVFGEGWTSYRLEDGLFPNDSLPPIPVAQVSEASTSDSSTLQDAAFRDTASSALSNAAIMASDMSE